MKDPMEEKETVTPEDLVAAYMEQGPGCIKSGLCYNPTLFVYGEKGKTRIIITGAPEELEAFSQSMLVAGNEAAHVEPYCVVLLAFMKEPRAFVVAAQRREDGLTSTCGIPFTEVGGEIILGEAELVIPHKKLFPLFQAFWSGAGFVLKLVDE